jgi:hypothetical protein
VDGVDLEERHAPDREAHVVLRGAAARRREEALRGEVEGAGLRDREREGVRHAVTLVVIGAARVRRRRAQWRRR